MTTPTKPILHNGFKVRDNLTVKGRIERIFFTEVYELSDGKFLYLFTNMRPEEVIDRVKKLAEELNYNFFELSPSSVATPWVHGAVGNIAKVFEMAKMEAPAIIFIDEIEGLIPKREELTSSADIKKEEINEFLLQLNNAGANKILVVGATNRPHMIDTAILRSGRMDKRIFVGPPDFDARRDLFRICLSGRPYDKDIDFEKLAKMSENYVGSDIELIVTEAARAAVFQDKSMVDEKMLVGSIKKFNPSITL